MKQLSQETFVVSSAVILIYKYTSFRAYQKYNNEQNIPLRSDEQTPDEQTTSSPVTARH